MLVLADTLVPMLLASRSPSHSGASSPLRSSTAMSPKRATGRSIELPPGSVAAYGHLQQNDLMEDGGVGSARRSFDDCFLSRFQKGTRWVEVEALTRWVEASSLLSMVPNLTTQVLYYGLRGLS